MIKASLTDFTAIALSWFINTSSIIHVHERLGRKHATIAL